MEIKENNFTQDELEMIKLADDKDHLYIDKEDFTYLCRKIIIDEFENKINKGYFKTYTYDDNLRFLVFMTYSPSQETADRIADEINKYVYETDKDYIMMRYAQENGFSDIVLNKFKNVGNPYQYCHHYIKHSEINHVVDDMKGLEKRRCTDDMIDTCIEIMEEVFTPFPDPPGSFRQDKKRIARDYMSESGGADLYYKDGALIGFCGHIRGSLSEVCVRNKYQGKGYGEVMVRSTLKSIYDLGYDAELYARHDNTRAIRLYEKVGFKKLYEAKRINLIRTN